MIKVERVLPEVAAMRAHGTAVQKQEWHTGPRDERKSASLTPSKTAAVTVTDARLLRN